MRKPALLLLPLLLCLGLFASCHKPARPSLDYQKARNLWLDLLKEKMSKAYADPGAEEVLLLLDRVDPQSMDAKVAADLKAEIQAGRAEALADADSLQKQVAMARNAATNTGFVGSGASPSYEPPDAKAGKPLPGDAGPAAPEKPTIGMSATDFDRKFSRCFEFSTDTSVGGMPGGRTYGMRDLLVCRELYPDLIDKGVGVFEGRVAFIEPMSTLAPKKYKLVEGRLVPMDEKEAAAVPTRAPTPAPGAPPAARPTTTTTGPGASVPQQIAPAADPSLNPKTTSPISTQP